MIRKITIVFLLLLVAMGCRAQYTENLKATFKDGHVTVTYDLVGLKAKERYAVDLYASYNHFRSPLKMVSGDAGKNISEGRGKTIAWNAAAETNKYSDTTTFQVKIALVFQPLAFINPTGGATRRGREMIVEWYGGIMSNEKELQLYRGAERIATFGKMKNVWQYTWRVPKDIQKGEGYTLRLSGGGENLVSRPFSIKSRTPLLLKLSPVFVAAAALSFLKGSSQESSGLPDPPQPE
jgi:hypothetical protein